MHGQVNIKFAVSCFLDKGCYKMWMAKECKKFQSWPAETLCASFLYISIYTECN